MCVLAAGSSWPCRFYLLALTLYSTVHFFPFLRRYTQTKRIAYNATRRHTQGSRQVRRVFLVLHAWYHLALELGAAVTVVVAVRA